MKPIIYGGGRYNGKGRNFNYTVEVGIIEKGRICRPSGGIISLMVGGRIMKYIGRDFGYVCKRYYVMMAQNRG